LCGILIKKSGDIREVQKLAFYGKFIINNEDLSPLIIPGVGTFKAYSGDGIYRNKGGCTAVPDNGPLPAGIYWIIDRPAGGRGLSKGCITLPGYADFEKIRRALLPTFTIPARNSGIRAYGTIEVVANGSTCP